MSKIIISNFGTRLCAIENIVNRSGDITNEFKACINQAMKKRCSL